MGMKPGLDLDAIFNDLAADYRQHNFVFPRRQRNRRSRDDLPNLVAIRGDNMRRIFRPSAILMQHVKLKVPGIRRARDQSRSQQRDNAKSEQTNRSHIGGSVSYWAPYLARYRISAASAIFFLR